MVSEILTTIVFGILIGIFTGLTPGIHINLISLLVVSSSTLLLNYFSLISLACFIISMSVTHTFIDAHVNVFHNVCDYHGRLIDFRLYK